MADMNKAEKLAAARKKLRQYQNTKESRSSPNPDEKVKSRSPVMDSKTGIINSSPVIKYNNDRPLLEFSMEKKALDHSATAELRNNNIEDIQNTSPLISYSFQINDNSITTSTPLTPVIEHNKDDSNLSLDTVQSTSESLRQLAMSMNGLMDGLDNTESPTILGSSLELSNVSELYSRNQQLAVELNEKDQTIAQLETRIVQMQKQFGDKEQELNNLLKELEKKWTAEGSALKEQLNLHTQTVGILVGEKTEAQAALSKAQMLAKTKTAEAEEAQGRLKASRQKLLELETTINNFKTSQDQLNAELIETKQKFQKLNEQLRKTHEETNENKQEIRQLEQKLSEANQEITNLKLELNEKQTEISLAQVKLQQLGGTVPSDKEITDAHSELQAKHEKYVELEQELVKLRSIVAEKDQSGQQYQQFIQQLNLQLTTLAAKLQETISENEHLTEHNRELLIHLSDLENRVQTLSQKLKSNCNSDDTEDNQMNTKLVDLQNEKEILESNLKLTAEKCEELTIIKHELEEKIKEFEENRPDQGKLLAAMESDKVAASRATTQNNQLKQELLEMKHVQSQLVDQLRHFEAKAQRCDILQTELINAQEEIKLMKSGQNVLAITTENSDNLTTEAASKLQERFTDTMRQLADVEDEKQRLEHLVLQLQGETETIGEYVTLYQQQRALLQQRAAEKDLEVQRMAADREQMRQKLQQVETLISSLSNKHEANTDLTEEQPNTDAVSQIKSLLQEIHNSESLAEPITLIEKHQHSNDTMLPCPLCSGRLEVV